LVGGVTIALAGISIVGLILLSGKQKIINTLDKTLFRVAAVATIYASTNSGGSSNNNDDKDKNKKDQNKTSDQSKSNNNNNNSKSNNKIEDKK